MCVIGLKVMVRQRKRTTDRGRTPQDVILVEVQKVVHDNEKLRAVASDFNIDHATLYGYCTNYSRPIQSAQK